jgi:hypothetical protein
LGLSSTVVTLCALQEQAAATQSSTSTSSGVVLAWSIISPTFLLSVAAVRGDPALPRQYQEKALLHLFAQQGARRRVLNAATRKRIEDQTRRARATARLHYVVTQQLPVKPLIPSLPPASSPLSLAPGSAFSSRPNTPPLSLPPSPASSPPPLPDLDVDPSEPPSTPEKKRQRIELEEDPAYRFVLSVSPIKTTFKLKRRRIKDADANAHPAVPKVERRRGSDRRKGADQHIVTAGLNLEMDDNIRRRPVRSLPARGKK